MEPCPVCQQGLEKRRSDYGVFWACPGCGNWLLTLPTLRRTVEPAFYNRLWQDARAQEKGLGTDCPLCKKPMNQVVQERPEGDPLVYQFCKGCLQCWLGPGERAALPLQAQPATVQPPEPPKEELPQEALQLLALHKVETIAENARLENAFDASHIPLWQKYLAAFGFPVTDGETALSRVPWATFSLALVTTLTSILFFTDYTHSVESYGFIPAEFDRMGGLTFLTCFFVHGGWMHLLGNMYFLVVFGRSVEDRIGSWNLLALLALATIGGGVLTLAVDPQGDIPHIGASGGISGVLLLYALLFPGRKLVFMFAAHIARPMMVRLPAWTLFLLWFASQLTGLAMQRAGMAAVSYSGHLGGLAAGLVYWLGWKWAKSGGWIKVKTDG